MPNPYFRFKQFTVQQDRCALKVGTDGVLLGAWASMTGVRNVLDIGTGTGVVALIAAQRCPQATVHAVEVDVPSASQAWENVSASPWPQRITVHHADIRHWPSAANFDLVLCNPPFYKGHSASRDRRMAVAKHEDTLTMAALFKAADRCCTVEGRLNVILPVDRWNEVAAAALAQGFTPRRICTVRYKAGKAPKRLLAEFARRETVVAHEELTVQDPQGVFTAAYRDLLRDLELHF